MKISRNQLRNVINEAIQDKFQDPNWKRHDMLSYNYRLSDIQSALGISQLKKLKKFINRKKEIAKIYDKKFKNTF